MTSASIYGRDPNRTGTALGNHEKSTNSGFLEELSFNHNLESQTTDLRGKSAKYSYSNINPGQSTGGSSGGVPTSASQYKITGGGDPQLVH